MNFENELIWLIFNPKSGTSNKVDWKEEITRFSAFNIVIKETLYAGHAYDLAQEAIKSNVAVVLVVGGDGTVNEAAKGLVNSLVYMYVIPKGSGNGFARFLKMPLDPVRAFRKFPESRPILVDTAKYSNHFFVGVAGVGFDALIAHQFDNFGSRGFISYCKLVFKSFTSYASKRYRVTSGNRILFEGKAFLLTSALGSEYGNRVTINPIACPGGGLIQLCILKPFKKREVLKISLALFTRKIESLSCYESISLVDDFEIEQLDSATKIGIHVDGEPFFSSSKMDVSIQKKSLYVLQHKY